VRLMTILRLCGQVVARVDDSKVEIFEVDGGEVRLVDRFVADAPIAWIELAPDGRSALVRDPSARQSWWWRRGVGVERLVTAASPRDPFGCGYVTVGGASVVLVAHAGRLRGLGCAAKSSSRPISASRGRSIPARSSSCRAGASRWWATSRTTHS
jgi:hypothetical protein